MSRSYKKNPVCKSGSQNWRKCFKKVANNKIRNYKDEIKNGKHYKKIFNSIEIYDYRFRESKEEYIHYYNSKLNYFIELYNGALNFPDYFKDIYLDDNCMSWKRRFYFK